MVKTKLLITLLMFVILYAVASIIFEQPNFLYFDVLWRIALIVAARKIIKLKLNYPKRQLTIISLVLTTSSFLIYTFSTDPNIIRAIIAGILAPVSEELFFRGALLKTTKGSWKQRIAITSLLFGVYHIKNIFLLTPFALFYQVLYAAIFIGPILGWVMLKYNNLLYTLGLHSINNLIGLTITQRLVPSIVQRK